MGNKIHLDKYYTPDKVAKYCYETVLRVIGKENITEIIEPSAGNGVFLDIDSEIIGYDIDPDDIRIKKADFLKIDLEYQKGRLFLGNPPYGNRLNLAQKFFKKCVELGDYIAFILPISQLNNTSSFYEFDLVHSEDLGKQLYSGVALHCVFNIYKRPKILHKRENKRITGVKIIRQDYKNYDIFEYDVRICYWGNTCMGKILTSEDKKYAGEYKIKVRNDLKDRDEIIEYIKTFDWNGYVKGISMKRLKQFSIFSVLLEKFPSLNEEKSDLFPAIVDFL